MAQQLLKGGYLRLKEESEEDLDQQNTGGKNSPFNRSKEEESVREKKERRASARERGTALQQQHGKERKRQKRKREH